MLIVSCPHQNAVRSKLAGVAELMIQRHHYQNANCGKRPKKADADKNPNSSKPSTSGAEQKDNLWHMLWFLFK
jgi:hypothetical protein